MDYYILSVIIGRLGLLYTIIVIILAFFKLYEITIKYYKAIKTRNTGYLLQLMLIVGYSVAWTNKFNLIFISSKSEVPFFYIELTTQY